MGIVQFFVDLVTGPAKIVVQLTAGFVGVGGHRVGGFARLAAGRILIAP